jgi:hypothetical protein
MSQMDLVYLKFFALVFFVLLLECIAAIGI